MIGAYKSSAYLDMPGLAMLMVGWRTHKSCGARLTSMSIETVYHELLRRVREEALLGSCAELLGWDEETYMPRGGGPHRGDQMALLAGLCHERATDPRLGELLDQLDGSAPARDPDVAVNLREIRRTWQRHARLPRTLVEELARTTTLAQQEWTRARQDADFAPFAPWLSRILHLKRQEAECLGYDTIPYDALLEEYEPGARAADLAELFSTLRRDLVPLAQELTHAPRQANVGLLRREYPIDRQRAFGETVAGAIGFDFERGRLDPTTHPFFSSIGPGDCRITTRFRSNDFRDGLFAILHEVGHGLYEQGLEPAHYGTPLGIAVSLAMHEGQARLWENLVGRSATFWQHFFPLARQMFHEALHDVPLDAFHFALNHVEPTLLRVGADEVTYNLHILIRFELEQALLSGDLAVADLPEAWHAAYRHELGIRPANDAEGCLQDGHWAAGMIGYFPTYTLGNVFAAQLIARVEVELGGLDRAFRGGDFSGLLGWLREHIHRQGCRVPARELIARVTGAAPTPQALLGGLRRKYEALYGI